MTHMTLKITVNRETESVKYTFYHKQCCDIYNMAHPKGVLTLNIRAHPKPTLCQNSG